MSKQSVMTAAIAALAIGYVHCGGRSSLTSSQSGAGAGGAISTSSAGSAGGTPMQPSSTSSTSGTSMQTSSTSGTGGMSMQSSSGATMPDAGPDGWTPQSLTGLVLWLDGTKGVQTSSGSLTSWKDQSGLNNDAAPALTGSGAPVLVANAIGAEPAVRFDGTNFLVVQDDASLQFGTGDFLVAVVARHTTPLHVGWGYGLLFSKQEIAFPFNGPSLVANTEEGTTQAAAQIVYHQAIIETAQSGLNDGQPMTLVMRRSGSPGFATLEIRLNGASSAIDTGSVYAADVSALGRPVHIGGTPAMQDVVGDIAEVIAVNGTTADADVAALEGYLETKYGL